MLTRPSRSSYLVPLPLQRHRWRWASARLSSNIALALFPFIASEGAAEGTLYKVLSMAMARAGLEKTDTPAAATSTHSLAACACARDRGSNGRKIHFFFWTQRKPTRAFHAMRVAGRWLCVFAPCFLEGMSWEGRRRSWLRPRRGYVFFFFWRDLICFIKALLFWRYAYQVLLTGSGVQHMGSD